MNTPSPLVPQGSLPSPKGKRTVHIVILTIVAFHAVFFAGLLMQGCKPEGKQSATDTTTDPPRLAGTESARTDANYLAPLPEYSSTPAVASRTDASALAMEPTPLKLTPAPVSAISEPAQPPAETKEYIIAKDDILANIAKANHITVGDLMKANPGIEPRKLKVGQKIQIPLASQSTASRTPAAAQSGIGYAEPKTDTGANETLYVIKSGDTLTKIARQHNVSVKSLRTANDLKTDQILVGKRLKIPAGSASGASATGGGGLSLTNPAGVTTVR